MAQTGRRIMSARGMPPRTRIGACSGSEKCRAPPALGARPLYPTRPTGATPAHAGAVVLLRSRTAVGVFKLGICRENVSVVPGNSDAGMSQRYDSHYTQHCDKMADAWTNPAKRQWQPHTTKMFCGEEAQASWGRPSRRRDCHLMAPSSTFSRCFNADKQGVIKMTVASPDGCQAGRCSC